jgi:pimeloyl-ACP methyl ester carboxylesterase
MHVVPGLGLAHRSWAPTLPQLGLPADAVLTLPAFGRPGGCTDLRPAALAELVVARLEDARPAVMVGHSSGCQGGGARRPASAGPRGQVGPGGPDDGPRASTWPRLWARWCATALHEDPRQVPTLVRQYTATGPATMLRAMDRARSDRLDRTLETVRCPVLVVRGRHDRICPSDWASSLTVDVITIPGAHMVPWTHGTARPGRSDKC